MQTLLKINLVPQVSFLQRLTDLGIISELQLKYQLRNCTYQNLLSTEESSSCERPIRHAFLNILNYKHRFYELRCCTHPELFWPHMYCDLRHLCYLNEWVAIHTSNLNDEKLLFYPQANNHVHLESFPGKQNGEWASKAFLQLMWNMTKKGFDGF